MTIAAAVMNTLENMETMLTPVSTEILDTEFSAVLDEALCEANVESSLDLTLSKDITETIENLETKSENQDETECKTDENNVLLFAQAFEAVNQTITNIEPETDIQMETSEITETAPEIETAPKQESNTEIQEPQIDEDMLQELNIESIEAETDTSSDNSSLLYKQSAEEHGIKIALNHEGVNEIKTFDIKTPQTTVKPTEITPSKIIEQVAKQLETLQHTSKVDIVLNPESLGKITIQLVKSSEGLSAQFTTATQEARNILMKGLDGLKETLTTHGVGVDNVSVKVSDTQKSEYNADWTEQEGSRGGNKQQNRQNREEKEKGLFEKTMEETK